MNPFCLTVQPDILSICRLADAETLPSWATGPGIWSVTRRPDELSVICATERVPAGTRQEPGWRALIVDGPLEFTAVGVMAALTAPLAEAGIPILAQSTFDTDVLLVRDADLPDAIQALTAAGNEVR